MYVLAIVASVSSLEVHFQESSNLNFGHCLKVSSAIESKDS